MRNIPDILTSEDSGVNSGVVECEAVLSLFVEFSVERTQVGMRSG